MNVLITSGSTTEKIDTVRSISNMSTGRLGCLIADRFSEEASIEKIVYICGQAAAKPESEKVETIIVDSVSNLERAIRESMSRMGIDIIVHAMAVSDYRVKSVTSAANVAELIINNIDIAKKLDNISAASAIVALLREAETIVDVDGKISSDMEDMLLFMERTPKIIALFQSISPGSTLVGFKLLDNVALDDLIDTGHRLLNQNKCSFVLANDLRDIIGEQHIGYLIDKEKNYKRYQSKPEIAAAIVAATISERSAKG